MDTLDEAQESHLSLIVSLEQIPNLQHKEARVLLRPVFLKLAPAVGVPPSKLRLKSWDGTVLHPGKTPLDYDLEDDDKIDLSIYIPTKHPKTLEKKNSNTKTPNSIMNYFAVTNKTVDDAPALTDGDEALAMKLQEEWDREAAQTQQKEIEMLFGGQAGTVPNPAQGMVPNPAQQNASPLRPATNPGNPPNLGGPTHPGNTNRHWNAPNFNYPPNNFHPVPSNNNYPAPMHFQGYVPGHPNYPGNIHNVLHFPYPPQAYRPPQHQLTTNPTTTQPHFVNTANHPSLASELSSCFYTDGSDVDEDSEDSEDDEGSEEESVSSNSDGW